MQELKCKPDRQRPRAAVKKSFLSGQVGDRPPIQRNLSPSSVRLRHAGILRGRRSDCQISQWDSR